VQEKVACKKRNYCKNSNKNSWNKLKTSYYIYYKYSGVCRKKLQKLALLITPEDKSYQQQNQAIHFFIGNKNFHWSDISQ